jgi:hypothetical protein
MEFDLRGASLGTIVGTGVLSAVLHVLRRPDHLCVIALLSIGGSFWHSCRLGLAWGLAHSVGIVNMAFVFSSTSSDSHFRTMSEHWNLTLALLLLLLGLWGLHHYLVIRKIVLQRLFLENLPQTAEQHALSVMWSLATIPEDPCSGQSSSDFDVDTSRSNIAVLYHPSFDEELLTPKCCCGRCRRPSLDMTAPATQTATALVFGLSQGLALAGCVFPASRLEPNTELAAYLVPLCATSILLVSAFAALFGGLTSRLARVSVSALYRIGLGSSGLCVFIAMAWVALVAAHKMSAVVG